jgi:hypothetical protein
LQENDGLILLETSMRLTSAQELKQLLLDEVVLPFSIAAGSGGTRGPRAAVAASVAAGLAQAPAFGVSARPFGALPQIHRSIALGVARERKEYRLAVRVQRPGLMQSPIVEHLTERAKGEADVRFVGRIDKRAKRRRAPAAPIQATASIPWYQRDCRPLLIGASVGHVDVTAGTIGGFVKRGRTVYVLSNNHVLANEDRGRQGDWILQRARYDGGRQPGQRIGQLRFWVRLKQKGANEVDAALANIRDGVLHDPGTLRGLLDGADGHLAGLGPELVDEERVHKVGRTTGATSGRVTAFDVDNVVVNYDAGNLRFDGQIEIEGLGQRAFSDGGDSGSLIVDEESQAVGLLFAGSETGGSNGLGLTYANRLHRVLEELRATLLF